MVYLRTEEINELATKLVHEYRQYIGADWGIFKVEPLKLAEMLGLEVKFVDLGYEYPLPSFCCRETDELQKQGYGGRQFAAAC